MKWLMVVVGLVAVSPALGAETVFADVSPIEIRDALHHAGLSAELQSGPQGPEIWSHLDKQPFNVFFFDCSPGRDSRCREVQFYAGFTVEGIFPTAEINRWNGSHRFGRAYIDEDGNAALEMDLDAVGTSEAQIQDSVAWWRTLVGQYSAFLKKAIEPQLGPAAKGTPTSAY